MRSINLPRSAAGHAAPITHVTYSPDGALVSTSSYDGSAIVWRVPASGAPVPGARITHRRLVNASSWSPHHDGMLATASADKTLGLWRVSPDGTAAEPVGRLARHTDDVNAVGWLPDGERIVTASEDSTALVWEVRTGRFLGKFAAHSGHCMAIAVSPGGDVLTVGEDGEVFVGRIERAARHRGFGTSIEGCAWSPDGSRIALACDDGIVRLLSPDLDVLDEIDVASSAARSVAFVDDGSGRIVAGTYDASVLLLDGTAVAAAARGARLWPRSVDTCGDRVIVGSFGAAPVVLALDGLAVLADGGPDTHGPNALAHGSGSIAVGLDSGLVLEIGFDALRTGSTAGATAVRASHDPVLSLASTTAGLLAGTYGGAVVALDLTRPDAPVTSLVHLGAPVPSLIADGDGALAGTYGGAVVELDLAGGISVRATNAVHDGSVKSLARLWPELALSAATDCAVRTFARGGAGEVLWFHGNLVNAVAADARGVVASASRDRLVRAAHWTGGPVRPVDLLGGNESMKAVTVLGEGTQVWVVGGSYDFALYGWELDLGGSFVADARAGEVLGEADQAISTILTLGPTSAVVASWDGTVRLLEIRDRRPVLGPQLRLDELVAAASERSVERGAVAGVA